MYLCCFFFLSVLAAGCSHTSSGEPVKVKRGETFEVKLESQVATGYRWSLTDSLDARFLELIEKTYQRAEEDVDGSPDLEIWKFKALSPGKTVINFLYNPAWQKEKADDAKTRSIEVIIE